MSSFLVWCYVLDVVLNEILLRRGIFELNI